MWKFLFFLPLIWDVPGRALPSSARLFQSQYGYRVSCSLCHSNGGGSALGKFGKEFSRAGANASAFKKIEDKDSDGDGIPNLTEFLAKSNAGDPKSLPTAMGDWLANVGAIYLPKKELEALFPGFSSFSAIEGSLNDKQKDFYRSKLGAAPSDDDYVPTFYFAEKEGKRQAVAQLLSEKEASLGLNTGIAVSLGGKILRVQALGGSAEKELTRHPEVLASYEGKSLATLPAAPSSPEAKLLHRSVLRNLYLVQAVFGGAQ